MVDNPELLLQDCDRELSKWLANPTFKGVNIVAKKWVSEWHKGREDWTPPKGMPEEFLNRLINRRRQILVYAYLANGLGQECVSTTLFGRLCRELMQLQAAWGHEFNFYDDIFAGFSEEMEDHLPTNLGIDDGVVKHAMGILATRKKHERERQSA